MIDLSDLRARPDVYQKAAKDKGLKVSVKDFLALDEKRRRLIAEVETMRGKKNEANKKIPTLKGKEKEELLANMKKVGEELKEEESKLAIAEDEWQGMQLTLPALPHPKMPIGKDEKCNVEIKKWGTVREFDFPFKDHVTLAESLDIVDFKRGVKVAGRRGYFLKGAGALLHWGLLHFAIDHLAKKKEGWILFDPPLLAGNRSFVGTGFFPGADQQNIYAVGGKESMSGPIHDDNLYIIGTSEVSVASHNMDEMFSVSDLPRRYCGHSTCFRREAGSYGKDTKGLYRVHQFQKVEQVVLCEADQDKAMELFEEIRNNAEEILQALELPYRVVSICTGDAGLGKVFMQDIETWMPSRNSYCETHSCSYLGDFQARRLNIRYEDASGKKQFVHTLNNTCIASPRILIPILEIYQNTDGSITVPEVLRPYMGGQEVICGKRA